ncbi:hypothetical protein M6B38_271595 [Iris pallida]|uniref:Uncharacterized protein n=1 Tax=Iris pallida TaxID=29817 RepID=A0AAX6GHP5_IRIPA|nr:hypothetical protein M6B38_139540 [Iris pallida]KAJ6828062.1 hypothetical protein M6B38_364830 [Iris pallida]KAJ6848998.1 hypothetical protein M6B38_271595 [Iris pallida]
MRSASTATPSPIHDFDLEHTISGEHLFRFSFNSNSNLVCVCSECLDSKVNFPSDLEMDQEVNYWKEIKILYECVDLESFESSCIFLILLKKFSYQIIASISKNLFHSLCMVPVRWNASTDIRTSIGHEEACLTSWIESSFYRTSLFRWCPVVS